MFTACLDRRGWVCVWKSSLHLYIHDLFNTQKKLIINNLDQLYVEM